MRKPRSFALCNKMLGTNLWLQVPSVVCRGTASVPEMSAGSINSFAKAELPLVKTWRRGVRRLRKTHSTTFITDRKRRSLKQTHSALLP